MVLITSTRTGYAAGFSSATSTRTRRSPSPRNKQNCLRPLKRAAMAAKQALGINEGGGENERKDSANSDARCYCGVPGGDHQCGLFQRQISLSIPQRRNGTENVSLDWRTRKISAYDAETVFVRGVSGGKESRGCSTSLQGV